MADSPADEINEDMFSMTSEEFDLLEQGMIKLGIENKSYLILHQKG